ncbi:MAG TPA: hypothetical protein VLF21_01405 [Candidatus Saccharimonadales bacterium]|nr:hypothetical protein [Candidatus Saccharimonadales bacterium]
MTAGTAVHIATVRITGTPMETGVVVDTMMNMVDRFGILDDLRFVQLETGNLIDEPISILGLGQRLTRQLWFWHDIRTVGELTERRREDLFKPHKIGWPSVERIEAALRQFGLALSK